jgi:hypothetical protein
MNNRNAVARYAVNSSEPLRPRAPGQLSCETHLSDAGRTLPTCSICGCAYDGFGHNAAPFPGRCCDACNWTVVIPARIAQLKGSDRT